MIPKIKSYILLSCAAALALGACSKDNKGYSHNPSNPIVVSSFAPEKGATGTEILINGSNFSTDTAQIRVSINGVPLKIVGAKENQIMAFLPQKTGTGPVTVSIGDHSGASTDEFNYQFSYVVTTLAGSGNAGFIDGTGAAASFNFNGVRSQLSVDDNGNVFVPDGGNQVIRKITPDGVVSTFAGSGANGFEDGPAATARFNNPCATTVDASGNVFVAERNGKRIRKITPDGAVSTWAYKDGSGLNEPTSLAINKTTGTIYWTDFYGDGVYTLKNSTVTRVINYSLPCTITIDASGNIYATHYDAHTVRKYSYNAATDAFDGGVDIVGKNGQSGWVDGQGDVVRLNRPWGIAIDGQNNLYVSGLGESNRNSNCVRMITPDNWSVTTIAGQGSTGFVDGTGTNARFSAPTGIAVDKNGDMYVLDLANQRIRKISVR
ncbi:MAG: IPT/TIG domain-containing protein [Candidatus Pseudobacter hemicellulosilyticus]|uniref:IPT/TIG domain-containing protein n=1 Tax=Candidatus Pseudobacter hemicellulosilyticus TaxID=3121375 RepID=A0AAJ5WL20_9BACT|nr:MAG: IPT/TIG domain-containing protein [Pseudobacter sp.]